MNPSRSSRWLLLSSLLLTAVACTDEESEFVPPESVAGSSQAGSAGQTTAGTSAAGKAGTAGTAGQGGKAGMSGSSGQGGASGKAGAGGGEAGGAGAGMNQGGAGAGGAGAGGTPSGGQAGQAGASGAGAGGAGAAGAGEGGAAGAGMNQGGAAGAGAGGVGGAGGGPSNPACLPASAHASVLAIPAASPLCAVRVHKTPLTSIGFSFAASWGRHGGPLTTDTNGAVPDVRRWTLPADVTAALSDAPAKTVTVAGLPPGIFYGPAIDVPFHDWTLLSYTGKPPAFQGELFAFDTALETLLARAPVNGFFSAAALPPGGPARLLFTALSPVQTMTTGTVSNGLYFLDPCAADSLLKDGCGTSAQLDTWESSSGPVAVDRVGTAFAVESTPGADQDVRGYTPTQVKGNVASAGTSILKNPDFSTSLAALANPDGLGGLLAVQSSDSMTYAARPVRLFSYAINGNTMTSTQLTDQAFSAVQGPTSPVVFRDEDQTMWVAVDAADGAYFVGLQSK